MAKSEETFLLWSTLQLRKICLEGMGKERGTYKEMVGIRARTDIRKEQEKIADTTDRFNWRSTPILPCPGQIQDQRVIYREGEILPYSFCSFEIGKTDRVRNKNSHQGCTLHWSKKTLSHVLISAGMELVLFPVACPVLCFVLSVRIMLRTHWFFGFC